jgi:hypothetical protein
VLDPAGWQRDLQQSANKAYLPRWQARKRPASLLGNPTREREKANPGAFETLLNSGPRVNVKSMKYRQMGSKIDMSKSWGLSNSSPGPLSTDYCTSVTEVSFEF